MDKNEVTEDILNKMKTRILEVPMTEVQYKMYGTTMEFFGKSVEPDKLHNAVKAFNAAIFIAGFDNAMTALMTGILGGKVDGQPHLPNRPVL